MTCSPPRSGSTLSACTGPANANPAQRLHHDANWYLGRVWAGTATRSMVCTPASLRRPISSAD